ncbi:MAG TPA: hypothetical protein VFA45_23280, partial [Actinomycetes bacterium]|nr:hypothetical protein [Actinomycetes bacterium]
VRDAYRRAGAAAAAGRAAPNTAEGTPKLQQSDSGGATAGVDQQACLTQARAVSSGDLLPAFFVDTVYQGRPATVLVARRAGASDQAELLAFPRGDCSAPPFATERAQVPAP